LKDVTSAGKLLYTQNTHSRLAQKINTNIRRQKIYQVNLRSLCILHKLPSLLYQTCRLPIQIIHKS